MKVIVNNLAVEYTDEGQGPVLLLLHGWKDSLHTFDSLVPEIGKGHRVVRLDLPGFGASDMPKSAWTLGDYTLFVRAFMEKLHLDIETIVGHSLGGRVAIKGVAEGTLRPRKIVLIASAGIAKRKTWRNALLKIIAALGKALTAVWPFSMWRQALRRRLYAHIGSDYFAAGALKGTFVNIIQEDLQAAASRIPIPTLLVWGSADTTTPLTDGQRLQSLIKGSQLSVIDGATHFVHREHPEEVSRLINQFI